MLTKYLGKEIVEQVLPPELRKRQKQQHRKRKHHAKHHHRRRRGWKHHHHHNQNKEEDATSTTTENDAKVIHAADTSVNTDPSVATPAEDDNNDESNPTLVHVAVFNGQTSPLEVELRNFVSTQQGVTQLAQSSSRMHHLSFTTLFLHNSPPFRSAWNDCKRRV
jgi:hypothetical protein